MQKLGFHLCPYTVIGGSEFSSPSVKKRHLTPFHVVFSCCPLSERNFCQTFLTIKTLANGWKSASAALDVVSMLLPFCVESKTKYAPLILSGV